MCFLLEEYRENLTTISPLLAFIVAEVCGTLFVLDLILCGWLARNGLILCKERWNTQTWAVWGREECTVRWWWWLQLLFYQLGIIHLKMNCKLHPGLPCWANLIVWEGWERIYPDESGWCLCLFCLWLWTGAKFQANNRETQVKYYLEVLEHCSSICWILILVSWELLCGMNMNWDHDICE